MSCGSGVIIVMTIFIVILLIYFFSTGKLEGYGGPIKNIRRIPKSTCYNICQQYYDRCMAEFRGVDAGVCYRDRDACINVCNYTNYHRQ